MPRVPLEGAPWPQVDFAAHGPIELRPLSRVQQLTASLLARNWAMIPHVTHHDEVDASLLDTARRSLAAAGLGRVTPLAFLVKAVVGALRRQPEFNASLDASATQLVLKGYFHIGVAVESPTGLRVPVIRDADTKSLGEIAAEILEATQLARGKGLPMARMSGGCFTISSLGSIGGTGFTPIVNAPELAILGVGRAVERPVRLESGLGWRTLLPLSLSYDHRVINGSDAARFCVGLGQELDALLREAAALTPA